MREQLLSIKPQIVEVAIHGLDAPVHLRQINVSSRNRLELELAQNGQADIRQKLAVAALCDDAGKPLFEPEEYPLLNEMPAYVLDSIFAEATKLNRLGEEEVEAEKKG